MSTTSNVPIEFLPNVGKRTAKVLRSLGVGTIGQFAQLPERVLIELFGPSILTTFTDEAPVQQPTEKRHLPLLKRLQLATQLVTLL